MELVLKDELVLKARELLINEKEKELVEDILKTSSKISNSALGYSSLFNKANSLVEIVKTKYSLFSDYYNFKRIINLEEMSNKEMLINALNCSYLAIISNVLMEAEIIDSYLDLIEKIH